MITKAQRHKSKKIMQSAKDEDCQVRLPNICNFNPETTVCAHRGGSGMGTKNSDFKVAYACSDCHSAYDQALHKGVGRLQITSYFDEGIFRTQDILADKGLIKI